MSAPGIVADAVVERRARALGLDPDDIELALLACRLWQRGPKALALFLSEFAAWRTLRTPLEADLSAFLDRYKGDKK